MVHIFLARILTFIVRIYGAVSNTTVIFILLMQNSYVYWILEFLDEHLM